MFIRGKRLRDEDIEVRLSRAAAGYQELQPPEDEVMARMMRHENNVGRLRTWTTPDIRPMGGSLLVGLVAALCCGGSLVFGAIGLGAFYSSLQLGRHIPEALATAAVLIGLLNWFYYHTKAASIDPADSRRGDELHRTMLLSTFLGLAMMAVSFVLLEWLNHGVVNASHFMTRPEYAGAIVPGVPNMHLGYVAMTFLVLVVLYFLPWPARPNGRAGTDKRLCVWASSCRAPAARWRGERYRQDNDDLSLTQCQAGAIRYDPEQKSNAAAEKLQKGGPQGG